MRLPKRKKQEDRQALKRHDHHMTKKMHGKLKRKIQRLEAQLPILREEVARTQAMGDLSENAAYSEAKYTLRKTMGSIERLRQQVKDALIIQIPSQSDIVVIGSKVCIESANGTKCTYQIVGPLESSPAKGRISHLSPLGSSLIGKSIQDTVTIPGSVQEWVIISIV